MHGDNSILSYKATRMQQLAHLPDYFHNRRVVLLTSFVQLQGLEEVKLGWLLHQPWVVLPNTRQINVALSPKQRHGDSRVSE